MRPALGAFHPRLGEHVDPGPAASRAHPDRKPWLLCVVEIVLRLARRQRGRTDRRVSELQVVLGPEIFAARFHRSCPASLCPGAHRGETKKRIRNRSLRVPGSGVPQGKNSPRTQPGHTKCSKACYGPLWPHMARNTCAATVFKTSLARFGWLRSTDCGSHGRGPRFDPLCVHH
jgi:hypothetical protein